MSRITKTAPKGMRNQTSQVSLTNSVSVDSAVFCTHSTQSLKTMISAAAISPPRIPSIQTCTEVLGWASSSLSDEKRI